MPTSALRRRVLEALEAATGAEDVPSAAAKSLDEETREWIILGYVTAVYKRVGTLVADPRQGWLEIGLPQFSHVIIEQGDTLDEYRERTDTLSRRIRSYGYARRRSEKLKRDKSELRERKALEKKIAPFFAADPLMTVDRAIELLALQQQSPRIQARIKGGFAKSARTKNQQLEHDRK